MAGEDAWLDQTLSFQWAVQKTDTLSIHTLGMHRNLSYWFLDLSKKVWENFTFNPFGYVFVRIIWKKKKN